MKLNSVKARMAAAIIATVAVAGLAAPARAMDLTIDVRAGFVERHAVPFDYRYAGKRNWRRPACQPHEAVRKAMRFGLRHADIRHVDRRVIIVSGVKRGHRASIAFARHSPRCHVVGTRGI